MKCPDCGMENKEGAQFCKNCGSSLISPSKPIKETIQSNSKDMVSSDNKTRNEVSNNKNTLIICITAIICVAIIAGAFVLLGTDILNDSSDDSVANESTANQTVEEKTNVTKTESKASVETMTFAEAKKLMSGSSNTIIRNTFDEADADGDGLLTGSEISKFKSLADLTARTADNSNTEHVEASDQGAGDGTTKTRYCTTHGRVAVGDDNRCPYCEAEGLDSRTVKGSTEYI